MNTLHRHFAANGFFLFTLLALFLLTGIGCGKMADKEAPAGSRAPQMTFAAEAKKADRLVTGEAELMEEGRDDGVQSPGENIALRGRKLIRDGQMRMKVKDVEQARGELEAIVGQAGGFVANINYDRHTSSRRMTVTLRLPAEGFHELVKRIGALGHVEHESFDVTDVTDRYVDLERRIATNEKLAARLEQLIENKSYRFKDLLEVESKLMRLRLDIERLQGSLRGLDDRISLSTLRIEMYQEVVQKVVPPDSVFAPIIGAIENAGPNFKGSLRAMMSLFGFIVRVFMVLLPWLILALIFTGIIVLLVKRAKRKKK